MHKNLHSNHNHTTVVWIHGANQSSLSFEYLRHVCDFDREYLINYTSSNRFHHNLEKMQHELADFDAVFVVGHSMGGLYGVHLTQTANIIGGVSISTPFAGSSTADWARYVMPTYPLFKDVGRRSAPVLQAQRIQLNIPWTQIISTAGSVPYHNSANDGVVTLESMSSRNDVKNITVDHNHYEVMCSRTVADIILDCYAECDNA
jgi:pimeloyl-ACP methyl ester carboxylesterase